MSEEFLNHILIVDDDPVTLRTMKVMLGNDYSVAIATSATQAMTAIDRKCPDLILLDYQMPVCDGKETLEMIRREESTKDIPVIFLTGTEDPDQIEEILALKPEGYFLKPPVRDKLLLEIQKVLNA